MSIRDRMAILRAVQSKAWEVIKRFLDSVRTQAGVKIAKGLVVGLAVATTMSYTVSADFSKVIPVRAGPNQAAAFNQKKWIPKKSAVKLVTWVHWIAKDTNGNIVWDKWVKGDALGGNSHKALNQTHHFNAGDYVVEAVIYYLNGGRNIYYWRIHADKCYCHTCHNTCNNSCNNPCNNSCNNSCNTNCNSCNSCDNCDNNCNTSCNSCNRGGSGGGVNCYHNCDTSCYSGPGTIDEHGHNCYGGCNCDCDNCDHCNCDCDGNACDSNLE